MIAVDLSRFIKKEFFILDISAKNKQELFDKMVAVLIESGAVRSKEVILKTLMSRESLGSTDIGKGVAIPHCRTLAVSDVHIVVALSKKGISYNSSDGKKVQIIFLIVAPPQEKTNLYLPILGKIVELLHDPKVRKEMLKAKDFDSFNQSIHGG